ncbi:hypothetical protein K3495_g15622, partial [Podosphaera aphanis]
KKENIVVTATQENGLYIVTHVDESFTKSSRSTQINKTQSLTLDHEKAMIASTNGNTIDSDGESDGALKESEKERYLKYHKRFAHLNPKKIRNLHKVTTLKTPIKVPSNLELCETCKIAKMRNQIPKTLSPWEKTLLGRIQCDVAGPFPVSIRGNSWYLLIVDIFSRRDWVIPIKTKGEACTALIAWKVKVEKKTGNQVKSARSDNAPELLKAIKGWEIADGTEAQTTTIVSSHQNGPAERNIQTVNADVRAMLREADLPIEFWDEAAEADSYMRNRTDSGPKVPSSDRFTRKRMSPMEAYNGKFPSIDHIRKWGSKCYFYLDRKAIPKGQRTDKLVNPGRVGVFMGYSSNTTRHLKVYSPEHGYTILSSRVEIDEKVKGGTIDLKLRGPTGPQGTKNVAPVRKSVGRPKKQDSDAMQIDEAPINSKPSRVSTQI